MVRNHLKHKVAGCFAAAALTWALWKPIAFAAPRSDLETLKREEVRDEDDASERDFSKMKGIGMLHEVIGEYALPKPIVLSPHGEARVREDLGVNVTLVGEDAFRVAPQHWSKYRPFGPVEEMYLRDMHGQTVSPADNPGVRVEPDLVSPDEEEQIMQELVEMPGIDRVMMASNFGYDFAAEDGAAAQSWRMTGRDEGKAGLPLAPWGWGKDFDEGVVKKLKSLAGYPLGPLRDDGPNSFVLSLLSSAVVTFSPIASLRHDAERCNDDEWLSRSVAERPYLFGLAEGVHHLPRQYAQHSYTDDDIDCLVPRRAVYHFGGNARYLWTHAVRGTWFLLTWCKQRKLAQRENAIAKIFAEVKALNKAITMVVSDASSSSFSRRNLSKYLLQRGLSPSENLLQDAQALLSLLQDDAKHKDVSNGSSSPGPRAMAHALKPAVIDPQRLQDLFPEIKASYVQQPLDYGRNSRYGDNWRISCYMVVMENWKPKIMPHEPMLKCLGDIMHECDGANVDGSAILALPTDEPFEGGALHVWDGKPKQELVYKMAPGDCMFMDTKIWHQAKPITSGTRWALVLFLKSEKPTSAD
ncbi:unnamed protein product [Durusdinium trenchii]|uniref:Prolyl 4-hydroxylase alpha subunit Fe(2+) 2OG dioxygenase domain-containing protein n=1 Tax=Durusdinium trenchii TaxID=1381693 RepID=A0ABP0SB84_9DINO